VLADMEQVNDLGGPGNIAVAMFQIQAAPSPRIVSWRTWSAPRRVLGEEDGELDLPGPGPAVLALTFPPGGGLRGAAGLCVRQG
jgi:hypothetical protein